MQTDGLGHRVTTSNSPTTITTAAAPHLPCRLRCERYFEADGRAMKR
jgi:hypothetical protein